MTPDVVADVGNTRVKWGVVGGSHIERLVALPDDPPAWEREREALGPGRLRWAVASVRPSRSERLIEWLRGRGDEATLLRHEHLALTVEVEEPHKVGIDRLLNAVAAASVEQAGRPAVLVDAGSAVTVDYLDEAHAFQGGTIFPGFDLMAEALHRYTALLPRVEVGEAFPEVPAKATVPAIQAGIFHAVAGGIDLIFSRYAARSGGTLALYLTGGQSALLEPVSSEGRVFWPEMTLHGILVAARGLS